MTWLDIEGTLIDDLENRNWLDLSNIVVCGYKFGLFTWGWYDHSEVDMDLVHLIEQKLQSPFFSHDCAEIITKKDCMNFMHDKGLWTWKDWDPNCKYDVGAELDFNSKFTKVSVFIEMFKDQHESWLFDDSIAESQKIQFLKSDNTIVLMNSHEDEQ